MYKLRKGLFILMGALVFVQVNAQERVDLTGPRWGVTVITGEISDEDTLFDESIKDIIGNPPAVVSQFGIHFEHRVLSGEGIEGVVELVVLAGGMDRGIILPSMSLPVGIRASSGWEIGFGPNVSLDGLGYVIAMGKTFDVGSISFPLNVAIALQKDGQRISVLTGYGIRGKTSVKRERIEEPFIEIEEEEEE